MMPVAPMLGACMEAGDVWKVHALPSLKPCSVRTSRLKAVESEASDEEVEEEFTMQLEQLIKQCDDELGLIPKMAEWKPWDVPAGHKVHTYPGSVHPAGNILAGRESPRVSLPQ